MASPHHATPPAVRAARVELLGHLYAEQQRVEPDEYLARHGTADFIRGTEQVFEWYLPWLEGRRRVLDWGCRHAPDSCLLSAEDPDVEVHGCDTVPAGTYRVFHESARLRYDVLEHDYQLPYDTGAFDAVIASGVLEHVPLVYESLKELSRVIEHDGMLIITFLPNRWSVGEWKARRSTTALHRPGQAHHLRTFALNRTRELLQLSGFSVVAAGYQTHLDVLPLEPEPTGGRRRASAVGGVLGLGRLAPCLSVAAQRLGYF